MFILHKINKRMLPQDIEILNINFLYYKNKIHFYPFKLKKKNLNFYFHSYLFSPKILINVKYI